MCRLLTDLLTGAFGTVGADKSVPMNRSRIRVDEFTECPTDFDGAQRRLVEVLRASARGFAVHCRSAPRHVLDPRRRAELLCAVGIGKDEAGAFMRAVDHGLVVFDDAGGFSVPGARAASTNLHLVGREGDHVKLHNEVLIHVGVYAELVLDHGWPERHLVFDPFISGAALDLWGYSAPTFGQWSDGQVVFVAEAKSRVGGGDGLENLLAALKAKQGDPAADVSKGHERKWAEILAFARQSPEQSLVLLLVAEGARWWFRATADGEALHMEPSDAPIPFTS